MPLKSQNSPSNILKRKPVISKICSCCFAARQKNFHMANIQLFLKGINYSGTFENCSRDYPINIPKDENTLNVFFKNDFSETPQSSCVLPAINQVPTNLRSYEVAEINCFRTVTKFYVLEK